MKRRVSSSDSYGTTGIPRSVASEITGRAATRSTALCAKRPARSSPDWFELATAITSRSESNRWTALRIVGANRLGSEGWRPACGGTTLNLLGVGMTGGRAQTGRVCDGGRDALFYPGVETRTALSIRMTARVACTRTSCDRPPEFGDGKSCLCRRLLELES